MDDEIDLWLEIFEYLESIFGVFYLYMKEIFLSDIFIFFFIKLVLVCVEENGIFVFFMGFCGILVLVVKFLEVDFRILFIKVFDFFKVIVG